MTAEYASIRGTSVGLTGQIRIIFQFEWSTNLKGLGHAILGDFI